MKSGILFIFIAFVQAVFAQVPDTLTLDYCYKEAENSYPLAKQKQILPAITDLRLKNLNKNYLPQIYLNGQASYQSDVTQVPIKAPGITIPEMDKDIYKVALDINQVVYDGGNTNILKKIENTNFQIDQQNLVVELYKLKDRINQLYFSVLLLQESERQIQILQDDLKEKLNKIESGVKNGILLASNADILKAEIIKTEQQLIEFDQSKLASIKMLGELLNKELSGNKYFSIPEINISNPSYSNQRPENILFDLQAQKTDHLKKLVVVKTMPKFSVFGQAGYGRPGYNMLNNEFDDYYMIGARLTWNIWNWNQNKNERKILLLQNDIIQNQKEVFDKNLKILVDKEIEDISKYDQMILKDKEIIEIRQKIVKTYSSQLENGIITATEYVAELNNKLQAEISLESHKIQLLKAKVNYLNLIGKN
jgi:outer membrane protein TolC